jgi:hypothetical protein
VTTAAVIHEMGAVLPQKGMEESGILDIWRAEKGTGRGKGGGATMAGCAPKPDGEAPDENEVQEAHSTLASLASYSPSIKRMVSPPPPTVRWQDVLHEAAAAAKGAGVSSKPRHTRSKWGRRSTDDIPKPGISTRKPQLVVVIDVSGSMTGLLEQVAGECAAIAAGAQVKLVLHDSQVLFAGEYRHGKDRIVPCGGTDFEPAIRKAQELANQWPGRSVVVHLTDGEPCSEWPDVPGNFAAGYSGIFGSTTITAPHRWRTRRCGAGKR